MKVTIQLASILIIVGLFGCQNNSEPELRQNTYLLHRANSNPVRGDVKVTELGPGKLEFRIQLENTIEGGAHPAHLHFGGVSEVGELALRLNDVDGATGESVTVVENAVLSDGQELTYDLFLTLDGSIKIHMNDNYFKHMVLSFGNVGKNEDYLFDGVAVCTGH
tara:strand:- start:331 stop:822 length:492 start_codon:yes stop_codon:yes gene_type:complete